MISTNDVPRLVGAEVHDRAGTRIGPVREIYLNGRTGEPEWVTVKTGPMRFQESFVPLRDARLEDGRLTVAVDELHVTATPLIDADGPLAPEAAARLYAHYGLTDDAMTRSEERLVAGQERVREPIGKVRLRKYVITEERQVTVPVRREEVRLEPVAGEGADSPSTADDPPSPECSSTSDEPPVHEITLHAERPVVSTETVPVEHVRLTKDTVRDQQTISGTVRREQIDYEGPQT